jgi:hypothetical protein
MSKVESLVLLDLPVNTFTLQEWSGELLNNLAANKAPIPTVAKMVMRAITIGLPSSVLVVNTKRTYLLIKKAKAGLNSLWLVFSSNLSRIMMGFGFCASLYHRATSSIFLSKGGDNYHYQSTITATISNY